MSDKDRLSLGLMIAGVFLLAYNVGSMARISSSSGQQVLAEIQAKGER